MQFATVTLCTWPATLTWHQPQLTDRHAIPPAILASSYTATLAQHLTQPHPRAPKPCLTYSRHSRHSQFKSRHSYFHHLKLCIRQIYLMAGGLKPPSEEDEQQEKVAAGQGVVFCLEDAQLEVAQVGKAYVLLNCDDHATYLRKHKKDPALYRPDICHQALLSILDSPLNKAGKVKAIFIRTHKSILISVSPKVRLPRTFRRFCGLMAQLLQKLSIRASNGPDKLLKVIKGPVTKHLPLDCMRLGFSHAADQKVAMHEFVTTLPDNKPIVFVVGAFAHGKIDAPWVDTNISVSEYPLSAAYCLARITTAFEQKWNIV